MISSFRLCVLLLCIVSFSYAGWKGTRVLYTSGELAGKAFTHINTDTGIVHNFGTTATKIIHRTYRARFGPVNTIADVQKVSFIDAAHTKHTAAGLKNLRGEEQIIVFVYQAPRSGKSDDKCTKGSTAGCSEIYIVESIDDGVTWKNPVKIGRANADDVANRMHPSVTYDREVDVIYLAYTYSNVETGEVSIGMIRKYLSEGTYRKEEILKISGTHKKAQNPKITITNPAKHKGDLHMMFTGVLENGDKTVLYTKSADKITSWKTPVDITPNDHKSDHYTAISAVGIAGVNDLFGVYTAKNGTETMFIYSENAGENWSTPKKINNKPNLVPFLKACGQTAALGAFFSLFNEKVPGGYELAYFNNTDMSIKAIPKPFTDLPELTHIPMGECTGLQPNDVKYIAIAGSKNSVVFDDYNYDYPESE